MASALKPGGAFKDPSWWTPQHESGWEKVKHSLRDGWESLKHSVGGGVKEPAGDRTPVGFFATAHPALRYGYGARQQFGSPGTEFHHVEAKLEQEWRSLGHSREWQHAREDVRQGWDAHRRETVQEAHSPSAVQATGSAFGGSVPGDSGSGAGP